MARNLNHDPLKLGWGDKSIIVGVKVSESLSNSFSPETFQKLGELLKADDMVASPFTQVKSDPIALEIEGCTR